MSGYGFSQKQNGRHYRPQVARAWAAHCGRTGESVFDHAARERWYRHQLVTRFNVYTTKQLDQKRDFEEAMALFEAIEGKSITWQLKAADGDKNRLRFLIRERCRILHGNEDYIQAVCDQMGFGYFDDLTVKDLYKVFQAFDTHVRRLGAVGAIQRTFERATA